MSMLVVLTIVLVRVVSRFVGHPGSPVLLTLSHRDTLVMGQGWLTFRRRCVEVQSAQFEHWKASIVQNFYPPIKKRKQYTDETE